MVNFPVGKIYNSYLIETNNYESTKRDILNFAINCGFDKNLVLSSNHPDISFLECIDEKIKISDIREIIESSHFSPTVCDKKFYIIYDVVNLDNEDQNMLLKTLEEPAAFDTFFLVTSNVSNLYDTIKSRCMLLRDEERDDYKKIFEVDFTDDAVRIVANLKYETESDIMAFADIFEKREDMFHSLINIYRYILRDAIVYKKTLSKELIKVKEKEVDIISIANSLTYEELGILIDNLDKLSEMKGYNIDKRIVVFNYLRGINGEMYRYKV